eukprot:GHRR01010698.1.p1 GENE.GHRR01010698.1~~GHRR01010698.1.p1  ORF type:complete len:542 (+),score=183.51 GHRR01010698.1:54-1679(+)
MHFSRLKSCRQRLRKRCLPVTGVQCRSRNILYARFRLRGGGQRSLVAAATAAAAAASNPCPPGQQYITLQQYDDFELLWLEYRHDLSISKSAAVWVLEGVQSGTLPCDADLVRDWAEQFTALGQLVPKLDTRRILNTSRHVLSYDARFLETAITKLVRLLPNSNPTQLVLNTVADLDLPAEVIALQYQELNSLFLNVLGSHLTAKPFSHLLQRLRQCQQQQTVARHPAVQPQGQLVRHIPIKAVPITDALQQHHTPAVHDSSFKQLMETSAGVADQLAALQDLLGPELAHAAVQTTPQLLDTPIQQVRCNLQWLQAQLRLSPVAAMLLAEQHGKVLIEPPTLLEYNYRNLCYLLQQLLGWRLQEVHTLLYNEAQLLQMDSQQLAGRWQRVQKASRKRIAWMQELAKASASLVAAVLTCQPWQLSILQFVADTNDLKGKSLQQVFNMGYVDFVTSCPGFRSWRAMAPGRWKIVDSKNSRVRLIDGTQLGSDMSAADSLGGSMSVQDWALDAPRLKKKVLAVDELDRPILMQVGQRGPYDRLA